MVRDLYSDCISTPMVLDIKENKEDMMRLTCITIVSDNALGKSRITGMHFALAPERFEDQVILQFINDNPQGIRFQTEEHEWRKSKNERQV